MGVSARVEQRRLAEAVAWVARYACGVSTTPVLAGVLIEAYAEELRLSAFDYETSASCAVPAVVSGEGRVLVSASLLAAIVKELPAGDVDLVEEGTRLVIRAGQARFSLPTMPVEDYPQLPPMPGLVGQVDADQLATAVRRIAVAAADDVPVVAGVLIELGTEAATLVATDRYRMAVAHLPWQPVIGVTRLDGEQIRIPAVTLVTAAKAMAGDGVISLHWASGAGVLGLATSTRHLVTRLIADPYPAWRTRIPTNAAVEVVIPTQAMVGTLRRAAAVATDKAAKVTISLNQNALRVHAGDPQGGDGEETLPVDHEGEPMQIAAKAPYLLDAINATGGDCVRLDLVATHRPLVIRPLDEHGQVTQDYLHLVMPLRLLEGAPR